MARGLDSWTLPRADSRSGSGSRSGERGERGECCLVGDAVKRRRHDVESTGVEKTGNV